MHKIHPLELFRLRDKLFNDFKSLLCEEAFFQLPHLWIGVMEDLKQINGKIKMTYTIKKGLIQNLRASLGLPEQATALDVAIKLHGEDVVCAFRALTGTMIRIESEDKTIEDLRPEIEEAVRNAERGELGIQAVFLNFYCTTGETRTWALPYIVEDKKITYFDLEEAPNDMLLGEIPFKGER